MFIGMALLKDGPSFYVSPEGLKTAAWHTGRARELEKMGWVKIGTEPKQDALEVPLAEPAAVSVDTLDADEPVESPVEATEPEAVDDSSQEVELPNFEGMLKYELIEYCNSHNIELPENATKGKILEILADPYRTYRHYE